MNNLPSNNKNYTTPSTYPPPPVELRSPELRTPELNSAARDRVRRRSRSRKSGGDWAWVIIAGALLSVVIIVSMSVVLLLGASQPIAESSEADAIAALPTPVDVRSSVTGASGNLSAEIQPGQEMQLTDGRSIVVTPWNGNSRLTILMMGLDRRLGETGLAYRTDTMLLVSLDPETDSLGILSIPRDLYVEVPGYSQLQRINTPMVLGELQQTGYGPTLAMQTIQYNLGIRVQEYVVVDFNAFITLVNTVGGVEVDVPYDIADYQYPDMNYGYDPFIIQAGLQRLDGETALQYARTRHNDNDFERARRQQQVIFAIRDQILNLNMLPQLIVQSPTLLNTLNEDVYTSLGFDEMIQLAVYLSDIDQESIHTGVIDSNYIMNFTTAEGAAVLIPRRANLGVLMSEVFGTSYSQ